MRPCGRFTRLRGRFAVASIRGSTASTPQRGGPAVVRPRSSGLLSGASLNVVAIPDNPVAPLVATMSAWLVLALVLLVATLVGSVSLGRPLAASGVDLTAMVVVLLLALWDPVERNSPAGPTGLMSCLAAGATVGQWWPTWTGLARVAASVTLAVVVFR